MTAALRIIPASNDSAVLVALAVNPEVEYVKVEHKGEYLILAKARLAALNKP